MSNQSSSERSMKQKALHELRELVVLSLYLALFFCALVTYGTLLLREYHIEYWNYAFALINALVIAKVIMIGEYAKVGKKYESRPLFLSAIWKVFLFSLLVLAFHIVEELIKHLVHGEKLSGTFNEMRIDEMLGRALVVFCAFIPLFGFREFRRILGEEKYYAMLIGSEKAGKSDRPTQQ